MSVDVYRIGDRTRFAIRLGGADHIISPDEARKLAVEIYSKLIAFETTAGRDEVESWGRVKP